MRLSLALIILIYCWLCFCLFAFLRVLVVLYWMAVVGEDRTMEGGKGQELDVFDASIVEWPDFTWSTGFASELLVGPPQKNTVSYIIMF